MKFLAVLLLAVGSSGDPLPKMPFSDHGGCPFECCQYGQWTARSRAKAFAEQSKTAPVAFTIRAGQKVQAVAGVVVTRRVGVVRMQTTTTFNVVDFETNKPSKLTIPAGKEVYTLHLIGEGVALFWYQGAAYSTELYAETVHLGNVNFPWDVRSLPVTEWWVKVKDAHGAIGWLLNPQDFHGMDACGS